MDGFLVELGPMERVAVPNIIAKVVVEGRSAAGLNIDCG
jgi:hypothetical protein